MNAFIEIRKYLRKCRLRLRIRRDRASLEKTKEGCGFLYIAFGPSFSAEALLSVRSLRRFQKERVCVFTDQPEIFEGNDLDIETKTITPRHLRAKVDYIDQSPFEKTIYLDSDTVIVQNVSDLFTLLERFDVTATIDAARKRENIAKKISRYKSIPYAFPEVNGGVLGFTSSPASLRMLEFWQKYFYDNFNETNGWDQPSLRIALWESQVRLATLPAEYNVRSVELIDKTAKNRDLFGPDHLQPRIFHMHHSSEVHDGKMHVEDLAELEEILQQKAIKIEY